RQEPSIHPSMLMLKPTLRKWRPFSKKSPFIAWVNRRRSRSWPCTSPPMTPPTSPARPMSSMAGYRSTPVLCRVQAVSTSTLHFPGGCPISNYITCASATFVSWVKLLLRRYNMQDNEMQDNEQTRDTADSPQAAAGDSNQ